MDQLLEELTEPQREAVMHTSGPLLVLAGPGSGKTRVITHRAAYLAKGVVKPWHILAITFTNKAAGEMAERIQRLCGDSGITCSTFHAFCARLLRIYGERFGVEPGFSIFDQADQTAAVKTAIQRCDMSSDNFPPTRILAEISRAKNDMITAEAFAESACRYQDKAIAQIYEAYNAFLVEQNALDFDDLLLKVAWMLRDHGDLRDQLEDRYRYVLVDEYQDTNIAQYMIGRLLAQRSENLCVTGDPDQSIYAWRGANIQNILQFEEDFPNAKVVRLEQNYRSTPQILSAADSVIRQNQARKHKELWTKNVEGSAVRVVECEDGAGEGLMIATEILRLAADGMPFSQMAIFYRVNHLSRQIEMALRDRTIPYQVARGVAFFQRKEIKDVLAYLKVVSNPMDEISLSRIINVPTRGIGETTISRIRAYAESVGRSMMEVLATPEEIPGVNRTTRYLTSFANLMSDVKQQACEHSLQDTLEFLISHSGLLAMWNTASDEDALDNAQELVSAAAEYDRQHADGSGSLDDWLQQIALVSDIDAVDPERGAVTLMTLHAAKGLEFDVVFMAGVEEGLLPHERSQDERGGLEEERRLCFVGMTRARRELILSSARWRASFGMETRTSRSIFLAELPRDEIVWQSADEEGVIGEEAADEEEMPASAVDFMGWRRGQLVRHPSFGIGRVLWIRPSRKQTRAGIHFASYGEKTLVLEYANLEPVDMDELEYDS
jgi:DNA helicase-2/ATP-dependent DNA helicase PcrA